MNNRSSSKREIRSPDFLVMSVALLTLWVLLAAVTFLYVVHESVEQQELELRILADEMGGRLRNQLKTQEAVLNGFAAFLGSGVATRDGAARYVGAAVNPHDHIYMLEAARRIGNDERRQFEQVMTELRSKPFSIRNFSYDRTRQWSPVSDKAATYPIVFLHPANPDSDAVIGLDLDSVPHLRSVLIDAEVRNRATASRPFDLVEGGRAYLMLQPVHTSLAGGTAAVANPDPVLNGTLYAMLLARTIDLEPRSVDARHAYRAYLHTGNDAGPSTLFERAASPASAFSRLLFPKMQYVLDDRDLSNPMTLEIERQIRWSDIDTASLAAIGLLSIASLALLLTFLYQMRQREVAQDRHVRDITRQALYDPVTGLASRILLLDHLRSALAGAHESEGRLAVLALNLEGMTALRERAGSSATDSVLRQAASRINDTLSGTSTVAVAADNEFVIVLPDVKGDEDALAMAEKLVACVGEPFPLAGEHTVLRPYVGFTVFPEHGSNAENLVAKASEAGFAARRSGWRNIARAD